jgi:hypothetical protein
MLFGFQRYSMAGAPGAVASDDWAGTWSVSGGTSLTNPGESRTLYSQFFTGGYLYSDGNPNGWARLAESGTGWGVTFDSSFWSGSFEAEDCGSWSSVPVDTGGWTGTTTWPPPDTGPWDTGRWDTGQPTFDPRRDLSVAWDWSATNGTVTVFAADSGADSLEIGFAETAAGEAGWYGEDCRSANCHVLPGAGGALQFVESADAVILGTSTLFDGISAFDAEGTDRLTHLIRLRGGPLDGQCWVWGHDPDWYADQGCSPL